ncbi:hypothetical protein V2G26_017746 [Clonostachys chloroleuca]
MADSTEQGASTTATEQQGVKLPNGYTRLPNGVVLDKEGKPCQPEVDDDGRRDEEARLRMPPDVAALGRSSWTLLHSIAATFPEAPSRAQQGDLLHRPGGPRVASRDDFGRWLCGAHNAVNRKLGKPVFDCDKWQERWVTGPKDGSCD